MFGVDVSNKDTLCYGGDKFSTDALCFCHTNKLLSCGFNKRKDGKVFFAYSNTDLMKAHTPNLRAARGECVQFAFIGAPVFVQVFGPWSKRPEGEGPKLCVSAAA